jgi:hypothetical protein
MSEVQRYAKVPAQTGRAGWQRTSEHTATAGSLQGRGTSIAAALESLGAQLTAMASRADVPPAFYWDADNQALHIAVPNPVTGDHVSYIVTVLDGEARLSTCTTSGGGAPDTAFEHAIGMERVVTGRRTGQRQS